MLEINAYKINNSLKPMLDDIQDILTCKKNAIVLVPEHYTLQAEKDLIYNLKISGLFNVEVLSPKRLITRIIASNPTFNKNAIDISGEAIAISIIAHQINENLKYYKNCFNDTGVYTELVHFISNLYSYGININQLESYIKLLPDNINKYKWEDIYNIYSQYYSLINSKYTTQHDNIKKIKNSIPYFRYLNKSQIIVYGFDALSKDLVELLTQVYPYVEKIQLYISLCDNNARDIAIYDLMKKSIDKLCTNLKELKGFRYKFNYNSNIDNNIPKPFAHLIKELYSKPNKNINQEYSDKQDNIFIYESHSPHSEVNFIADKILALKNNDVELSKIAIFVPNNSEYSFMLDSALKRNNISFCNIESFNLGSHPISKLLINSLRAINNNPTIDSYNYLINSMLYVLDFEESSFIKNYMIEHGILAYNFQSTFARGKDNILKRAEEIRKKFMSPLINLKTNLEKHKNVNNFISACTEYIDSINIFNKYISYTHNLYHIGYINHGSEIEQISKAIADVLEQIYIIMQNNNISLEQFTNYLEYGLAMQEINVLPPVKNSVLIGPLDHMLVNDIDYLFILGFNDDFFDSEPSKLFSDFEINEFMKETDAKITLLKSEKSNLNALHLKRAMTLSKNKLYLSYSINNIIGTNKNANALVSELCNRYFSKLKITKLSNKEKDINNIVKEYHSLIFEYINSKDNIKLEQIALKQKYLIDNGIQKEFLDNLFIPKINAKINDKTAKKLFNSTSSSISRLESYANCPYKYFIDYGVKPKAIEPWQQNSRDTGIFYHSIMESLAKDIVITDKYNDISENDLNNEIDKLIDNSSFLSSENFYKDTKRNENKFNNEIKRAVIKSAQAYIKHMQNSDFRTIATEQEFNLQSNNPLTLNLHDGRTVILRGCIDRVDTYNNNKDTQYIRIIDYKSSNKQLNASKIYYGTQLQLLIYLHVALNTYIDSIPSGAFYFYIHLPWKKNSEINNPIIMKGIVLNDDNILKNFDKNTTISKSITQNDNKDKSMRINKDDFKKLIDHSLKCAINFAENINDGKIEVLPLGDENGNLPCRYCDYKNICRVDPNQSKKINNIKNMQDLLSLLDKQ